MLTGLCMLIGSTSSLVFLSGLLTILGNRECITPDQLPCPSDPAAPPDDSRKGPAPGTIARHPLDRILGILDFPSWGGMTAFAAAIAIFLLSAFIVLFIELPLPAMTGLGVTSVTAAGLSARAIRRRHSAGSWLPKGSAGNPDGTALHPNRARETPGGGETAEFQHPAGLPEAAFHATLEHYWVDEPYSYVTIERVRNEGFTYIVVEPALTQKERTILMETYAHLRDIIIYDRMEDGGDDRLSLASVAGIIRQFDPDITEDRVAILYYYIRRDLSGYGPLEVLMRDPALEDLSCNGNDLPVFVFHRAYGSLPTSIFFTETELNQFVLKLAQKANKQMSLSNPMVDATLPDGARIQITYSGVVSTRGSSFTIRKFRAEPMTPLDLIRFGTYDPRTLAFLWLAIEHRKSLLVVGGTASGKTSMMNAVSLFIPQNAKIVSLEDTREIQLPHRNWLPTRTRELNTEGIRGDIDLFSLLKACMRQRPEYIIVGEVRGVEAQTLFQAMNSGHATLSTIHAGSVYEAINRLTHDPINVPPVMFQALDLVVVQSIYTLGKTRIRRCLSIHEIEVTKSGEIHPILLFEWNNREDTFRRQFERSRTLDEIAVHCGWDAEELERQLKIREEFFSRALNDQHPTLRDLANAIHDLED